MWARSAVVQIRTRDVGAARRITVGGDPADFMGIVQRAYSGDDGLPAVVTLDAMGLGGTTLDLTIDGGGGVRHVAFPNVPAGQDDDLTALQMAERIRTALDTDPAVVTSGPVVVGLRFSTTDPTRTVRLVGTAVARLRLSDTPPQPTLVAAARVNGFDLEPPPPANPGDPPSPDLTLTIGDGTNNAPQLTFVERHPGPGRGRQPRLHERGRAPADLPAQHPRRASGSESTPSSSPGRAGGGRARSTSP